MGNFLSAGVVLLFALIQSSSPLVTGFERIALNAQGRVGAAVMLIETGETVGLRSGEKFPMQSVFKLPIAVSILQRVDQGKISLEQKILVKKTDLAPKNAASEIRDQHPEDNFEMSVRDLLHAMMDVSDGTACDVLLRMAGGPVAVTKFMHSLGVKEISIAVSEKELIRTPALRYRNWATPRGTLELLRILQQHAPISRANRDLLLQLMAESRTGPQRIKGLLPQGTIVSHKTGSSGTADGITAATNDVGIVNLPGGRHLAIAVYVARSKAGEAVSEGVIAEIARAAWDHYIKR